MRTTLLCLFTTAALVSVASAETFRDGDVFRLAVGGAPREFTQDFELEYTIDGGMVTIPIIGRMRAQGLSASGLAAAIERRLRDEKIFVNPSVILNPVQKQSMIVVGGAVRASGRQQWSEGMTLTQAIASASGPSEWAEDKVKLIRGGRAEVYSRKAIKKNPETDPRVLPGDFVEVQGEF